MNSQKERITEVFNVTRLGASHIKSGKPCQDASLSWESDDGSVQIAIVCDGHGGDTYVRSDVGSRLAAEITARHLREMSDHPEIYGSVFFGKSGAVTARPTKPRKLVDPKSPTETELAYLRQDEKFRRQYQQNREQDKVAQTLFGAIWKDWMEAIEEDARAHPFSEAERNLLAGGRLAKAYGSTLIAFMQTPYYWFAFQIGDGKMLCCDYTMTWREPVPWDCNCFLNMTTSLCYADPLPSFRYAYDGTGNFPMAVIMGSDGLDDSWVTMENLQDFYSQTLRIFQENGKEKTLAELGEYLSNLSQKGSRDDMSMAGIIDVSSVSDALKMYTMKREGVKLRNEFQARQKEIEKEQAALKEKSVRLVDADKKITELRQKIEEIENLQSTLEKEQQELNEKIKAYTALDEKARAENNRLLKEWNSMKEDVAKADEERLKKWKNSLGILPWENNNEEPSVISIPPQAENFGFYIETKTEE